MFSFYPSTSTQCPVAGITVPNQESIPIFIDDMRNGQREISSRPGDAIEPFLYSPKRLTMLIAGSQGCGKSFLISKILREYIRHKPNRPIILFTGLDEEDANFAGLNIIRANINKAEEITLEKLRNKGTGSICIFDDVDRIRDKRVSDNIQRLISDILSNGRDHKTQTGKEDIDIIVTNHELNDYRRTKYTLSDCEYVCLFPQGSTYQQLDLILKKIGCSQRAAEEIKNEKSRYVIIHKTFPLYYISSNRISELR